MSRGIRADTLERIEIARNEDPLALGPLLGALASKFNISSTMIGTIVKVHEQTVLRWFFGQTSMNPKQLRDSTRILAILAWMHTTNVEPLTGNTADKMGELHRLSLAFKNLSSS